MQSEVKTTTQFGFEVQLSKVYTRAVFADFKETLYRSTAFRAERCPENPTKYLVHHYNSQMHLTGQGIISKWSLMNRKVSTNVNANSGHTQVRLLSQKILVSDSHARKLTYWTLKSPHA